MPPVRFAFIEGYESFPPRRGTPDSAGMDVYIPMFNDAFNFEFLDKNQDHNKRALIVSSADKIIVKAGGHILIPTGLKLDIPKGTYIDVCTKSGHFANFGMKVGSHVIDADYQGQVYISLFNTNPYEVLLVPGKACAQLIHKPCIIQDWEFTTEDHLHEVTSVRGTGGFGSTGESGGNDGSFDPSALPNHLRRAPSLKNTLGKPVKEQRETPADKLRPPPDTPEEIRKALANKKGSNMVDGVDISSWEGSWEEEDQLSQDIDWADEARRVL